MTFNIYGRLNSRQTSVAVIGMGYVGRPLALALSRHFNVVGYDVNPHATDCISEPISPLKPESGDAGRLELTDCEGDIANASFYIITVGTPVDSSNNPDLSQLLAATRTVGGMLKPGDYVVYESTVFPGCTENVCVPLLEEISGLKCGSEFKAGYSPERINPTDALHEVANISKIIAGCDEEATAEIERVYSYAVSAPLHKARSIRSAEAAKLLENIQRCMNIALMNEMSVTFGGMGIDFGEVVELAATKWNFTPYSPGLVGGHCIPVDPYYLMSEARRAGIDMPLTRMGCSVNEMMPGYVADSVAAHIPADARKKGRPRALVLGISYKRNSDDVRNSGVAEMIALLEAYGIDCDVVDRMVDGEAVKRMYGLELKEGPEGVYDAVIVAVNHDCYTGLDETWFERLSSGPETLLADLHGVYRGKVTNLKYWAF